MADSLPLQPQSLKSDVEMSEGSAPTVAGSEKGGGPSSVSEGASATSGDNIRGLKEALQRKKEALVARKRELDSGPLRVTRSDEGTDEPQKLHQKLSQLRERLEILDPIIAQLDADYTVTADIICHGKTSASETELRLMAEISSMRQSIEAQESAKTSLEQQMNKLDENFKTADPGQMESLKGQRHQLESQLLKTLADLEINKLEACSKMHEAAALISRAQRHGEATETCPGYASDQGTSSGYASEAASSRAVPFGCRSHAGVQWAGSSGASGGNRTGGETDLSDIGEDSASSGPKSGTGQGSIYAGPESDVGGDVILPWNMRPAANYYQLSADAEGCCAGSVGAVGGGGFSGGAGGGGGGVGGGGGLAPPDGGGTYVIPDDAADYNGPQPHSLGSMQQMFREGVPNADHYQGSEEGSSSGPGSQPAPGPDSGKGGAGNLGAGKTSQGNDQDDEDAMLGAEDWEENQDFANSGNAYTNANATNAASGQPASSARSANNLVYTSGLAWEDPMRQGWQDGPKTPPTPAGDDEPHQAGGRPNSANAGTVPAPGDPDRRVTPVRITASKNVEGAALDTTSARPYDQESGPQGAGSPGVVYMSGLGQPENWPGSRETPATGQASYQPASPVEHQIRDVARDLMSRVPSASTRPSSSGPGYLRGPSQWPPTPPTPDPSDGGVDPSGRPAAAGGAGYMQGLYFVAPHNWPPSVATPSSRETSATTRRPGRVATTAGAPGEHSSSETLVRDDGSPRSRPGVNSDGSARYVEPDDAAGYDGPQPHTIASLDRVFQEGVPGVPSIYYTPPQKCCSSEQFFTPAQSANEMADRPDGGSRQNEQPMQQVETQESELIEVQLVEHTGDQVAEHTGDQDAERVEVQAAEPASKESLEPYSKTVSGQEIGNEQPIQFEEREEFNCRGERLMSRYEGLQPCLPIESLQQGNDGSEPWSSPRSIADTHYEPAQGEYGFQRYPQGYDPPQMWYGHERASLPSDAGSELAPVSYDAASDSYVQSQGESDYPASLDGASDITSVDADMQWRSEMNLPAACMDVNDPQALAEGYGVPTEESRDQQGPGPGGSGGPPDGGGMPPSDGYEPAQGEYGFQRYPQGYETPQMWYGHERASLPGWSEAGNQQQMSSGQTPSSQPAFGPNERFDYLEPDTTKTLARIVGGEAPSSSVGETGASGGSQTTNEGYEPAQGEYGYQRYPQGYEPPQLWYGHERAVLPGQSTEGQSSFTTTETTGPLSGSGEAYEPAQGEYGYQRYPQGYETPQMWYGHERASLPNTGAAENVQQSLAVPQAMSLADSDKSGFESAEEFDPYEPAQGEYGYQRYPQGYEPPQLWYGHERSILPEQSAGSATQQQAPSIADSDKSAFESAEEFDYPEPDTTRTLARILAEETNIGSYDDHAGESEAQPGQYTQGLRFDEERGWPPTPPTPSSSHQFTPGQPTDEKQGEGYEPAQGEYGYQRYPQGFEPAQMWYGHERAALHKQQSDEQRAETSWPELPAAGFTEGDNYESKAPDTAASLNRMFKDAMPYSVPLEDSSGSTGVASQPGQYTEGLRFDQEKDWPETPPTPGSQETLSIVRSARERAEPSDGSYEPAQGEYGYQRYPQGHEPAQMWYGHERAALPKQQSDEQRAETSWPELPAAGFTEGDSYESKAPDTAASLNRMFKDAMPYSVPLEDSSGSTGVASQPGQYTEGLRFDQEKDWPETPPTPGSQETLSIVRSAQERAEPSDGSYEPAQGEYGYQRYPQGHEPAQMWYGHEHASLPKQESDSKSATPVVKPVDGSYEPAQGEYGYQRYPQGHEPAQMWYGHDRATLPGQGPDSKSAVTVVGPSDDSGAVLDDYESISPDTTRTLAQIFQAGTPYAVSEGPLSVGSPSLSRTTIETSDIESTTATMVDEDNYAASCEDYPSSFTTTIDEDNLAATCQDYQGSQTSLSSIATPHSSMSTEYIQATGMYGYEPVYLPPSRGSVEHLPPSDGTYTQGICAFDCPNQWPASPPTPAQEDVRTGMPPGQLAKAATKVMEEYTSGLRWDSPKDWASTPATPSSLENLWSKAKAMGQYTSGLRWDLLKGPWPPTPNTPSSAENLRAGADERMPPMGEYMEGIRWDLPSGEWPPTPATPASVENLKGSDRTTGEYTSGLRWDGPRAGEWPPTPQTPGSIETLHTVNEIGKYTSGLRWDRLGKGWPPTPATPDSRENVSVGQSQHPQGSADYEPAQGIYGFQRHLTPMQTPFSDIESISIASEETFDGPSPDTCSSLERIFEAGIPQQAMGSQRAQTPSPNLSAFLEKLTSSSESEDNASRRSKRRPSDSAPPVRVPGNRFYSMEEMCTTAPSQPNLALPSPRASVRSDKECYLPWTQRAVTPFRNPVANQCVDYQEPPLVDMDDRSIPTPSTPRSRLTDSSRSASKVDYLGHTGDGSVDTPSSGYQPPAPRKKSEILAGESKSVESAHNDIEEMLARLRSLESRLHSVEDESQSKDRQIQELLSRLENLVATGGSDEESQLNQRLQDANNTIAGLEDTEKKLRQELDDARKEIEAHTSKLENFQSRIDEMEQRLAESQRLQAAGDQQLQQLAEQCGQLAAERDQLKHQLEESAAAVAEKEARIAQLLQQLQEYREHIEQLEKDVGGEEPQRSPPPEDSDVAAENALLRKKVEELERMSPDDSWKQQLEEAEQKARAMEKAVDQLTSEKRTAEERRREVETQLVQMVKKSSIHTAIAVDDTTSTTEASSGADELLDPQLCRRLQQLLDKLHTQGLQAMNMTELKFIKTYASPNQLVPRSQSDAVVEVGDMDYKTLQRAISRLSAELSPKEKEMNQHAEKLAASLKEELPLVQELQRELAAEHDAKLALTERLSDERGAAGQLEADLVQMALQMAQQRGGSDRPDKTRSLMEAQLQSFAAAKTATQQLVDREQRVMQELSRTTDTGCKDLERVQACLVKLNDSANQFNQLIDKGNCSAVKRLADELLAEQQRCRDMLVCLECERGRAVQLYQELDQGRVEAKSNGLLSEKVEQRITELETKRKALQEQVENASKEVNAGDSGNPAAQKKLEVDVRHLQQDVRQVQGINSKVAEDVQKPAADNSDKTAKLSGSAGEAFSMVTTVVDTNVEAERIRSRIIQLAIELCGREPEEEAKPPTPEPEKVAEPKPEPPPKPKPEPAAKPEPEPEPPPPVVDEEELCSRWQKQLETERKKWGQERSLLQSHIDELDKELERLRVSGQSKRPMMMVSHGQGDDARVQEANSRYLRAESYRRALCWQKRYLMILLGGYQDTETMTLEKMVQLTGGCFLPNYCRLLRPIRKFRAAAYTVIAMLRMQFLVNRWRSGTRRGEKITKKKTKPQKQPSPHRMKLGPSKYHSQCTSSYKPPTVYRSQYRPSPRSQSPPKKPSPVKIPLYPARSPSPPSKKIKKNKTPSPVRSPARVAPTPPPEVEDDPVDDEITPRGESTGTLVEEDLNEEVTPRSISRGSTIVLDEVEAHCCNDDAEEEPLLPCNLLSDITLSSEESECSKFFTEYGSQLMPYTDAPDMEFECGTAGSMPNLTGFDTRSVCTVSDVESDELEHYLRQFDSLLMFGGFSSQMGSSTTSQSPRSNR